MVPPEEGECSLQQLRGAMIDSWRHTREKPPILKSVKLVDYDSPETKVMGDKFC